jgi:hypothetical protein
VGEYLSLLFRQKQQQQEMTSIATPKPTNHTTATRKRGAPVYATDCIADAQIEEKCSI